MMKATEYVTCPACGVVKAHEIDLSVWSDIDWVCDACSHDTATPASPDGLKPVAWMHNDPNRVDVIHESVRKLLADSADSAGHLIRPLDKSERYTIPLYASQPPAQGEAGSLDGPQGWLLQADVLERAAQRLRANGMNGFSLLEADVTWLRDKALAQRTDKEAKRDVRDLDPQFIVICQSAWANETGFGINYSWDGERFSNRSDAIKHGWALRTSDDFNIAQICGDDLIWFGWMDKRLDEDEATMREIANAIGLAFDPLAQRTESKTASGKCGE